MTCYKIRNKDTGLYSKGGSYVTNKSGSYGWGPIGKTWTSRRALTSHLSQYVLTTNKKKMTVADVQIPANWEIVEFEIKETSCFNALEDYKKRKGL